MGQEQPGQGHLGQVRTGQVSVGIDLVYVPDFAAQLDTPGTRFADVFDALELRVAAGKPAAQRAAHLAGRWAVKEAFIKAWSQALYGCPPLLPADAVDFAEIQVRPDAWGRIDVALSGAVAEAFAATWGGREQAGHQADHTEEAGQGPRLTASLSHDGDYATATCIIYW